MHVDDFVNNYATEPDVTYARWVLMHFRLPAALALDFEDYMKDMKLFCTYKGKRYRVTGASRMGDIWLASDFERTHGYDHRVDVDEVSEWSKVP